MEITPTDATPFDGDKSLSRSWLGKRNSLKSDTPACHNIGRPSLLRRLLKHHTHFATLKSVLGRQNWKLGPAKVSDSRFQEPYFSNTVECSSIAS
jgi:hypothetical protein